jgi:hypothetical protein
MSSWRDKPHPLRKSQPRPQLRRHTTALLWRVPERSRTQSTYPRPDWRESQSTWNQSTNHARAYLLTNQRRLLTYINLCVDCKHFFFTTIVFSTLNKKNPDLQNSCCFVYCCSKYCLVLTLHAPEGTTETRCSTI